MGYKIHEFLDLLQWARQLEAADWDTLQDFAARLSRHQQVLEEGVDADEFAHIPHYVLLDAPTWSKTHILRSRVNLSICGSVSYNEETTSFSQVTAAQVRELGRQWRLCTNCYYGGWEQAGLVTVSTTDE